MRGETIDIINAVERERMLTPEQRLELDDLLCRARSAARKLETMYIRGECSSRMEVDRLIEVVPRLVAAIGMLRGATPSESEGESK